MRVMRVVEVRSDDFNVEGILSVRAVGMKKKEEVLITLDPIRKSSFLLKVFPSFRI